jgi:hypothetical protein
LHPEGTNYFKSTYALTKEGRVWNTTDFGDTWTVVKNPIDTSLTNPILSTAFYLFSIYQNILTCIRYNNNMITIHSHLETIQHYIQNTENKGYNFLKYSKKFKS